jgi:hypothetical protein
MSLSHRFALGRLFYAVIGTGLMTVLITGVLDTQKAVTQAISKAGATPTHPRRA